MANDRFVLAIGGLNDNRPTWTTILIHQEYFFTGNVQQAISEHLTLPIADLVVGGMNGVLISLEHDPTTEAALNHLFTLPLKRGHAAGYAEHIRFTPPEL
jgi:hypothetical protein